ncbi:MAG: hypothetical protein MI974_31100 [Chitinophagales bacterium]|nr:hypothetical protein [Chitinophagales bacterium]
MGASAKMIAFDLKKFTQEIIPWLMEGEKNEIIDLEQKRQGLPKFHNLSRIMELFTPDLRSCKFDKRFAADEENIYHTSRIYERPNEKCWTYEDLVELFEGLVLRYCAKYQVNLGRIYRLERVINSPKSNIQSILNRLSDYSFVWNHSSGGFEEGFYGWIDTSEANTLLKNIGDIQLVKRNSRANQELVDSFEGILEKCVEEELGLSFGNDLHFTVIGNQELYRLAELIINEEFIGGEPRFEMEIIKDYRPKVQNGNDL